MLRTSTSEGSREAMFQFPGPIRATVGLIAMAADNLRKSPEKLIEIPMLAVSTALQASIRTQQRYAQFTVRGDEILGRMRSVPDAPPSWATFDDEIALPAKLPRPKNGRKTKTTESANESKGAPESTKKAPGKTA
jgi:hypothetical protein